MTGRVRQVVRQTKAWVFQGITKYPQKIVSLFEPHTEIIRKGKASKPNEFGNLVKVQEAENQIITHYEVFAERPEDSHLLFLRSNNTSDGSGAYHEWWPPTRGSTV